MLLLWSLGGGGGAGRRCHGSAGLTLAELGNSPEKERNLPEEDGAQVTKKACLSPRTAV